MKRKHTWFLLALLFFGAFCFGAGVLYGQHQLTEKGFVYTEKAEETETAEDAVGNGEKINLNTADGETLRQIEGVGEVTAGKIVTSREEEGLFDAPYDLVTRGILGETKYCELEPYVTVE